MSVVFTGNPCGQTLVAETRGQLILLCTDITLAPLAIIQLYGWRFKIEVSFKQAVHTVGTYAYHFWMKALTPIRRGDGNQYLHRQSDRYRAQQTRPGKMPKHGLDRTRPGCMNLSLSI